MGSPKKARTPSSCRRAAPMRGSTTRKRAFEMRPVSGSAHDVHGCGLDHVRHALLARGAERVLVLIQVLLRQAVDMRVRILLVFGDDRSADSYVAIGVVGVDDRQRDLRADLHIL